MDAVRVLPQVARAEFDIPTETFSIELKAGASTAPILATIKDMGYTPEVLNAAPAGTIEITHLRNPTSTALRDAMARAGSRGVPLVIDFGGPFCHLCRKFEQTALKDKQVVRALAGFELLRVDVEGDPDAVRDLDIHGVPDIWMIDGEGKILARHNGYMTSTEFLAFLVGTVK